METTTEAIIGTIKVGSGYTIYLYGGSEKERDTEIKNQNIKLSKKTQTLKYNALDISLKRRKNI